MTASVIRSRAGLRSRLLNASGIDAAEWRQFQLLRRDSLRQLLASASAARNADPMQMALWGGALLLTPPFLVAARKTIDFPFLIRAPLDVVERILVADRIFFVLYAMLATVLLAALTWDALAPTRADQEIVGVLPVRPRTLAAARFAAAVTMSVTFAVAINGPAALLYSLASSAHPITGPIGRLFVAHLLATVLGSVFVFLSLVALRSAITLVAGERMAARVATALQVVTFIALVEVFFFLPAVLPALMRDLRQGGGVYWMLPPVWFTELFGRVAEGRTFVPGLAALAVLVTIGATLAAVASALLPARAMARRALESRVSTGSPRAARALHRLVHRCSRSSTVRGLVTFAVASVTRSRRHSLMLATYLGLAIAVALVQLLSVTYRGTLTVSEPRAYLLAIPLIGIFFAVLGLRAACMVPVDAEANWPLRLHPPAVADARTATRLFLLVFGVLPIVAGTLTVASWLWGVRTGLALAAFDGIAGGWLVEVALWSWTRVPFATEHEPLSSTLSSQSLGRVAALYLFGFVLAGAQAALLRSTGALPQAVAVAAGALAITAVAARRRMRGATVSLDAPADTMSELRLSPALD